MVIVTHESCDSVLVGMGNRKVLSRCLKTASNGADLRRGEAGHSRRWHQKPETSLADYRDEQAERPDDVMYRRPQPSSGCHVWNTG